MDGKLCEDFFQPNSVQIATPYAIAILMHHTNIYWLTYIHQYLFFVLLHILQVYILLLIVGVGISR